MTKPRIVEFTVKGNGIFPIGMLRYDACYPDTQRDVDTMMNSISAREVTLIHRFLQAEHQNGTPTKERWDSFGWHVMKEIRR